MEKQLAQRIKASPIWREKDQLLQSVPGVGKVLAATLLAGVPELGLLSRTEIASLIGVAPYNADSCNTNKVRHIQGGRQDIRKALFCTTRALVSRRYNPLLVEFYERLRRKGKPKKVALVACMRKLLIILNSMVATNTPWRVSS
jgi:transposase